MTLTAEQEAIRAKCFHPSGTFVPFERAEVEQSIPERFEKLVGQYSYRIAVKTPDSTWSYDELNQAANRTAHAILALAGEGNEPVAVLLEQGTRAISALLATLKAGKIYVPLDASYPRSRTEGILEDTQARLIVTNTGNLSLASELARGHGRLLNIDDLNSAIRCENISLSLAPDTACIFYTSGSTGQPKGVVHSHRSLLHMVRGHTNNWHICAEDKRLVPHSRSVASAMPNIFSALLNGAALYPFDVKQEGVARLAAWLLTEQITIFQLSATLFRQLAETLNGDERFPSLRVIKLSSEAVYKTDVDLYKKHFSADCIFTHGFAGSEFGRVREYFIDKQTEITGDVVPVGYAVEGSEILLLDDAGQEVAPGSVGEIAVKSRYLSPGYWRNPKATQAAFLKDANGGDERIYLTGDLGRFLADGCLVHCGRKDFRIKVRGYSVEPAEIEKALLSTGEFKEAVVAGRESEAGDSRLVAYLVPGERAPGLGALRRALAEKLPDYMIPSAFVVLERLPTLPGGKIDRNALPLADLSRRPPDTPYVPPRTALEAELATIWSEALGLDQVGMDDRFLDLGGHSLAAAGIISRVLAKFRLELPVKSLVDSPTVADMAAVIARDRAKGAGKEDLHRMLEKLEALSDEDARRLLESERKPGN